MAEITIAEALKEIGRVLAGLGISLEQHKYYQGIIAGISQALTDQERAISALTRERDEWKAKAETLKNELRALQGAIGENPTNDAATGQKPS